MWYDLARAVHHMCPVERFHFAIAFIRLNDEQIYIE